MNVVPIGNLEDDKKGKEEEVGGGRVA